MPQDLYTQSSTQGTNLGARATTGDGRYFRYALVGATALVPGQVYTGPNVAVASFNPSGGLAVASAAATGTTQVTSNTSQTLTANQTAGGIMSIAVTPGQGYSYRIKGNTAVSASTGAVYTLEDPLLTNLTTSSKFVVSLNQYNGITVLGTASNAAPVGVAIYPVTAAYYGWIQTRGIVSCLLQGTPGPGQSVGINLANTTGALSPATGVIYTPVGNSIATGASGEYDTVFLQLD